MTANWLTFQSFQHGQEVLKAINRLSVFLKLRLAGIVDEERSREAARARNILSDLLAKLEVATRQSDLIETASVLGADSRLRQLASNYLTAQRTRRFRSPLFTESISETRSLLQSDTKEDQETLIECLAELRVLVEEHIHEDSSQILGAI